MAKGLDCGTSYYIASTEDSIKKQRNAERHKQRNRKKQTSKQTDTLPNKQMKEQHFW